MDRDTISKLLQRRPFEPFEICLSDGHSASVKHPETAFLTKSKILVVDPLTDAVEIISLLHITSIRTAQAA